MRAGCLLALLLTSPIFAQNDRAYPPKFDDAQAHVYKRVGDVELKLYAFLPPGHQTTDRRPAIVFFFGGGWTNGSPKQFEQQCRYLASRGMVAITADYRVASRHKVTAVDCVRDAKSAVRWVRSHAAELGVDPERIAAGGGSAGGHIAACTGCLTEFDETNEDAKISSRPNALVLFNPAVSLDADPKNAEARQRLEQFSKRFGVEPERLSPKQHVAKRQPPTLILIGTKDFLIDGNREFTKAMKSAGNRCELTEYADQTHGFFNFGRGDNQMFRKTLTAADKFLTSLGYLEGEPRVTEFFAAK